MAGISANALKGTNYAENRKKFNGNELQSKEFEDGSGLEWFDFNARTYDQQTGRFMQIDPWIEVGSQEMLTPYQFSGNNPIRYNDPDGKCPWCPVIIPLLPAIGDGLVAFGAATGVTYVVLKAADQLKNVDWKEAGSGNLTFAPHITIPQSELRTMQDEANAAKPQPPIEISKPPASESTADQIKTDTPSEKAPGTRRQNRIPDKGEPNTTQTNKPGTTTKKYGPDGNVQKEYNKPHQGDNVPKNEQSDHVHDYKLNPHNPSGRGDRQPGRPPKKNELKKDFGL